MDAISWNGVGKRREFAAPSLKRDKSERLLALFGKQAESREHSTQQRSGRKKRGKINRIGDRQRQTDSSKSMTKHGPTCDLIGKGSFWPPSSRLFGFFTESFFFSWIKCQLGQCFSFFFLLSLFYFFSPLFFGSPRSAFLECWTSFCWEQFPLMWIQFHPRVPPFCRSLVYI